MTPFDLQSSLGSSCSYNQNKYLSKVWFLAFHVFFFFMSSIIYFFGNLSWQIVHNITASSLWSSISYVSTFIISLNLSFDNMEKFYRGYLVTHFYPEETCLNILFWWFKSKLLVSTKQNKCMFYLECRLLLNQIIW